MPLGRPRNDDWMVLPEDLGACGLGAFAVTDPEGHYVFPRSNQVVAPHLQNAARLKDDPRLAPLRTYKRDEGRAWVNEVIPS